MDNEIISRLQEIGLTQDQIDDLLPLLTERQPSDEAAAFSASDLRAQLALESDPIRRAILAARVISHAIEHEY